MLARPLAVPFSAAVPDSRGAGDPGGPFLAGGVERECGLQEVLVQVAAFLRDQRLPVAVAEVAGLVRRPGRQPGELPDRGGQRLRQLRVQRGLPPVLENLPYRHRELHCHRCLRALDGPISRHRHGKDPGTCGTSGVQPSRPSPGRTAAIRPTSINYVK
jgi:hypothetical protein